jgi:carotenoid 1,2-hydratase
VTGTIQLTGSESQTISFTGKGYHDHNYGTAPIGPGLKRWIWGRVFFDDAPDASRVVTFHFARPRDASLPDELHVTEADATRFVDQKIEPAGVHVDWSRRTALLLAYPDRLVFGDVMTLSNPRLIDAQPFYLRLMYDAESLGKPGKAFCEVAYPHRLRWPILGRMIEMSIDRRDRKR